MGSLFHARCMWNNRMLYAEKTEQMLEASNDQDEKRDKNGSYKGSGCIHRKRNQCNNICSHCLQKSEWAKKVNGWGWKAINKQPNLILREERICLRKFCSLSCTLKIITPKLCQSQVGLGSSDERVIRKKQKAFREGVKVLWGGFRPVRAL